MLGASTIPSPGAWTARSDLEECPKCLVYRNRVGECGSHVGIKYYDVRLRRIAGSVFTPHTSKEVVLPTEGLLGLRRGFATHLFAHMSASFFEWQALR
jgi:hypothetical protein